MATFDGMDAKASGDWLGLLSLFAGLRLLLALVVGAAFTLMLLFGVPVEEEA